MQIFLVFATEACALRSGLGWSLDRVQREAEEFLRKLTITVIFAKFPGCDRVWISNWNGSIQSQLDRRFKTSPEWMEYEELLLANDAQKPASRLSAGTAEKSRSAENSEKTAAHIDAKRAMSANLKMCIGANIERLRKECGWSLDVLSQKTGLDKKSILNHVHGRSKPNPRTQREYAQAFTKELRRAITANDLEQ